MGDGPRGQYCRPRSVEKGVSIGRAPGQPNGYGLLGNKGATLLMGCDSRRSPTRNSFLPSGMLNRDHYHTRKNY
ncbi:hypothetical protein J6590_073267 [Homalodisca vitripennis]|nr:hypothetical protein J6590_073267 [Homalodisca vitripennis]